MRTCATPGCTKPDFHAGAHSYEEAERKARCRECNDATKDVGAVVRSNNKFQHGIEFVRMCIDEQHGVKLQLPDDMRLSDDPRRTTGSGVFGATLRGAMSDKHNNKQCVARVEDDCGKTYHLTCSDLVRDDVVVDWKPLSDAMRKKHNEALVGKEHEAAARRTEFFVKTLQKHYKTRSRHKVFSLDGIGANREVYMRGFANVSSKKTPKFYTFEIDPEVALSQQLLYGKETVVYTGAMQQQEFGYGCYGALRNSPPGIEYLITNRKNTSDAVNTLITKEDCAAVVGLNLDFCGGIIGGLDFEEAQRVLLNMLSRLPNLVVLCLTIGKRRRAGLKYDFAKYARMPYGFRVEHTFDNSKTDNKRVVSKVFVRVFSVPRTLLVPGGMWVWNMAKDKTFTERHAEWKCVIKSIDPHTRAPILYSIDDDMDDQLIDNLTDQNLRDWAIPDKRARQVSIDAMHEVRRLTKMCDEMQADRDETIAFFRQEIQMQIQTIKTTNAAAEVELAQMNAVITDDFRSSAAPMKTIISNPSTPIHKRKYRCSICGLPKKGHICSAIHGSFVTPKKSRVSEP